MFHNSYHDARAAFRNQAQAAGGTMYAWPLPTQQADATEPLTIDAAVFGSGRKALVLSSGLHGVEGFAGSAIQLAFIKSHLAQSPSADRRIVLLHVINPFGMANLRRVNGSNVDLNRNFLRDKEQYRGSSDGYRRLNTLLNPTVPTGGPDWALAQTGFQVLRHGFSALKTAIVCGQYDYPKGLFYGGDALQAESAILLQRLPSLLEGTDSIIHIDYHTGLGKSGTYALLVDAEAGSRKHLEIRKAYGEAIQPWDAAHGVAYKIKGGLPEAMGHLLGDRSLVLTCEFGTIAALHVLKALRSENQASHWGGDLIKAKSALSAAFCPDDAVWRSTVIEGGMKVAIQAIARLNA